MDIIAALCAAMALMALGLATLPRDHFLHRALPDLYQNFRARRSDELRAARLSIDPQLYVLACLASPPLLLIIGLLLGSPFVAIMAALGGFAAPRLYLHLLVQAQQRRTEAEAPRMLQIIVASLTAGRTYLEALQEVRQRIADRWLRRDVDYVLRQFHLDAPMERAITEVRTRITGRNLGLIWDNLAICVANRLPAAKAKGVFIELSSTVQFNVQLQQEVKARTSGQRAQIWMLAVIVPGLFLYLRLINPDFFTVLNGTFVGRFVLLPVAVTLEMLGIVLSFRLARVDA